MLTRKSAFRGGSGAVVVRQGAQGAWKTTAQLRFPVGGLQERVGASLWRAVNASSQTRGQTAAAVHEEDRGSRNGSKAKRMVFAQSRTFHSRIHPRTWPPIRWRDWYRCAVWLRPRCTWFYPGRTSRSSRYRDLTGERGGADCPTTTKAREERWGGERPRRDAQQSEFTSQPSEFHVMSHLLL